MRLQELTELLITARLVGDGNTIITGAQSDSRLIEPGQLFVCVKGESEDGHHFAAEAAEKGAAAIVAEQRLKLEIPQLIVKDSRYAMGVIADYLYAYPSTAVKLIGVTGTNGKTTTTYLIERILNERRKPAGVIGTIDLRYAGSSYPTTGTTPQALELQSYLAAMRDAGMEYCAMEVSSHALEQRRVLGCRFRTAIFTNLTQDHLDYHETMEQYADAKGLFFSRLGNVHSKLPHERTYAVLNADDPVSAKFTRLTSAEVITYGIDEEADVRASGIRNTAQGTTFHVRTFRGDAEISLQLAGKFNIYNALAAIAAVLIEGVELHEAKETLERLTGVPGRVEKVDAGQSFTVIVDYAHTPDGLQNVLKAIKEFAKQRIICVFGCGGDRDRTKRPIMGQIAACYSDYIIVTSDNPRSEPPERIIADIEAGLKAANTDASRYMLIADRKSAIKKAVEMASTGDVVLIAGKGHETYQLIDGIVYPFDDRVIAKEAIRGL